MVANSQRSALRQSLAKLGAVLMLTGFSLALWLSTRISPWEPADVLLWEWLALIPLAIGLGLLALTAPDWRWWRNGDPS